MESFLHSSGQAEIRFFHFVFSNDNSATLNSKLLYSSLLGPNSTQLFGPVGIYCSGSGLFSKCAFR